MFPQICIKSNNLTSEAINDRQPRLLLFLWLDKLSGAAVHHFTHVLTPPPLLSSPHLSSPPLFVCSDQLTGIDVAAETIRWPPVKQRTGGWLACQQRCGHTALWRQRYKLHYTQTGLEDLDNRLNLQSLKLNGSLSTI